MFYSHKIVVNRHVSIIDTDGYYHSISTCIFVKGDLPRQFDFLLYRHSEQLRLCGDGQLPLPLFLDRLY